MQVDKKYPSFSLYNSQVSIGKGLVKQVAKQFDLQACYGPLIAVLKK